MLPGTQITVAPSPHIQVATPAYPQDLAQVSSPSPMPLLRCPDTPVLPSLTTHAVTVNLPSQPTPTLDSSSLNTEMIYIHIYAVSEVPGKSQ